MPLVSKIYSFISSFFASMIMPSTSKDLGSYIFSNMMGKFWQGICGFFYFICKWLLAFMDFLQYFIQKLIGLDYWLEKTNNGNRSLSEATSEDILFKFLYADSIQKVFRALVAVFVVLLIIFTIYAIIKSEWDYVTGSGDNTNSKASIFKSSIKAIVLVVAFPILLVMGIVSSNAILASIINAVSVDMSETFGGKIFSVSAQSANKYRHYADANKYLPTSDQITFYMNSDRSKMIVFGGKDGNPNHICYENYDSYLTAIRAGVKITIDKTIFDPLVPANETDFSGFCYRVDDEEGNYEYYFVKATNENREDIYCYLNYCLCAKVMEKNSSWVKDSLGMEIQKNIGSNFESDKNGFIKGFSMSRANANVRNACRNTWNYSLIYVNPNKTLSQSLSSKGNQPLNTYSLGNSTTYGAILYNSSDISAYFDGGQFGNVQSRAEYQVMADVVDFMCENNLNFYIMDATSSLIDWNHNGYAVDSKWISSKLSSAAGIGSGTSSYFIDSEAKIKNTVGINLSDADRATALISDYYLTFLTSYSSKSTLAAENEQNIIYRARFQSTSDGFYGSELEGSKYIICFKDGNNFYPLVNGKTVKIDDKTYNFQSDYYSSDYRGVVFAKGTFDTATVDGFFGNPTFLANTNTTTNTYYNSTSDKYLNELSVLLFNKKLNVSSNMNDAYYYSFNETSKCLDIYSYNTRLIGTTKVACNNGHYYVSSNTLNKYSTETLSVTSNDSAGKTTFTMESTSYSSLLEFAYTGESSEGYYQFASESEGFCYVVYVKGSTIYAPKMDSGKLTYDTSKSSGTSLSGVKLCYIGKSSIEIKDDFILKSISFGGLSLNKNCNNTLKTTFSVYDTKNTAEENDDEFFGIFRKNSSGMGITSFTTSSIKSNTERFESSDGNVYYNLDTVGTFASADAFKAFFGKISASDSVTCFRNQIENFKENDFGCILFEKNIVLFKGIFDFKLATVQQISTPVASTTFTIAGPQSGITFDYFFDKNIKVNTFYSTKDINYFILIVSAIMIIKVLFNALWGVIKRFYMITLYYLAMPVAASTMPIDNGQRFGSIRESITSQVLSTYGVLIGLNVFFVLLAPIDDIAHSIFTDEAIATSGSYFLKNLNISAKVLNEFIYILFLLVAFTLISELPGVVQGFVGKGGGIDSEGGKTKDAVNKTMRETTKTVNGVVSGQVLKDTWKNAKEYVPGLAPAAGLVGAGIKGIGNLHKKEQEGENEARNGGGPGNGGGSGNARDGDDYENNNGSGGGSDGGGSGNDRDNGDDEENDEKRPEKQILENEQNPMDKEPGDEDSSNARDLVDEELENAEDNQELTPEEEKQELTPEEQERLEKISGKTELENAEIEKLSEEDQNTYFLNRAKVEKEISFAQQRAAFAGYSYDAQTGSYVKKDKDGNITETANEDQINEMMNAYGVRQSRKNGKIVQKGIHFKKIKDGEAFRKEKSGEFSYDIKKGFIKTDENGKEIELGKTFKEAKQKDKSNKFAQQRAAFAGYSYDAQTDSYVKKDKDGNITETANKDQINEMMNAYGVRQRKIGKHAGQMTKGFGFSRVYVDESDKYKEGVDKERKFTFDIEKGFIKKGENGEADVLLGKSFRKAKSINGKMEFADKNGIKYEDGKGYLDKYGNSFGKNKISAISNVIRDNARNKLASNNKNGVVFDKETRQFMKNGTALGKTFISVANYDINTYKAKKKGYSYDAEKGFIKTDENGKEIELGKTFRKAKQKDKSNKFAQQRAAFAGYSYDAQTESYVKKDKNGNITETANKDQINRMMNAYGVRQSRLNGKIVQKGIHFKKIKDGEAFRKETAGKFIYDKENGTFILNGVTLGNNIKEAKNKHRNNTLSKKKAEFAKMSYDVNTGLYTDSTGQTRSEKEVNKLLRKYGVRSSKKGDHLVKGFKKVDDKQIRVLKGKIDDKRNFTYDLEKGFVKRGKGGNPDVILGKTFHGSLLNSIYKDSIGKKFASFNNYIYDEKSGTYRDKLTKKILTQDEVNSKMRDMKSKGLKTNLIGVYGSGSKMFKKYKNLGEANADIFEAKKKAAKYGLIYDRRTGLYVGKSLGQKLARKSQSISTGEYYTNKLNRKSERVRKFNETKHTVNKFLGEKVFNKEAINGYVKTAYSVSKTGLDKAREILIEKGALQKTGFVVNALLGNERDSRKGRILGVAGKVAAGIGTSVAISSFGAVGALGVGAALGGSFLTKKAVNSIKRFRSLDDKTKSEVITRVGTRALKIAGKVAAGIGTAAAISSFGAVGALGAGAVLGSSFLTHKAVKGIKRFRSLDERTRSEMIARVGTSALKFAGKLTGAAVGMGVGFVTGGIGGAVIGGTTGVMAADIATAGILLNGNRNSSHTRVHKHVSNHNTNVINQYNNQNVVNNNYQNNTQKNNNSQIKNNSQTNNDINRNYTIQEIKDAIINDNSLISKLIQSVIESGILLEGKEKMDVAAFIANREAIKDPNFVPNKVDTFANVARNSVTRTAGKIIAGHTVEDFAEINDVSLETAVLKGFDTQNDDGTITHTDALLSVEQKIALYKSMMNSDQLDMFNHRADIEDDQNELLKFIEASSLSGEGMGLTLGVTNNESRGLEFNVNGNIVRGQKGQTAVANQAIYQIMNNDSISNKDIVTSIIATGYLTNTKEALAKNYALGIDYSKETSGHIIGSIKHQSVFDLASKNEDINAEAVYEYLKNHKEKLENFNSEYHITDSTSMEEIIGAIKTGIKQKTPGTVLGSIKAEDYNKELSTVIQRYVSDPTGKKSFEVTSFELMSKEEQLKFANRSAASLAAISTGAVYAYTPEEKQTEASLSRAEFGDSELVHTFLNSNIEDKDIVVNGLVGRYYQFTNENNEIDINSESAKRLFEEINADENLKQQAETLSKKQNFTDEDILLAYAKAKIVGKQQTFSSYIGNDIIDKNVIESMMNGGSVSTEISNEDKVNLREYTKVSTVALKAGERYDKVHFETERIQVEYDEAIKDSNSVKAKIENAGDSISAEELSKLQKQLAAQESYIETEKVKLEAAKKAEEAALAEKVKAETTQQRMFTTLGMSNNAAYIVNQQDLLAEFTSKVLAKPETLDAELAKFMKFDDSHKVFATQMFANAGMDTNDLSKLNPANIVEKLNGTTNNYSKELVSMSENKSTSSGVFEARNFEEYTKVSLASFSAGERYKEAQDTTIQAQVLYDESVDKKKKIKFALDNAQKNGASETDIEKLKGQFKISSKLVDGASKALDTAKEAEKEALQHKIEAETSEKQSYKSLNISKNSVYISNQQQLIEEFTTRVMSNTSKFEEELDKFTKIDEGHKMFASQIFDIAGVSQEDISKTEASEIVNKLSNATQYISNDLTSMAVSKMTDEGKINNVDFVSAVLSDSTVQNKSQIVDQMVMDSFGITHNESNIDVNSDGYIELYGEIIDGKEDSVWKKKLESIESGDDETEKQIVLSYAKAKILGKHDISESEFDKFFAKDNTEISNSVAINIASMSQKGSDTQIVSDATKQLETYGSLTDKEVVDYATALDQKTELYNAVKESFGYVEGGDAKLNRAAEKAAVSFINSNGQNRDIVNSAGIKVDQEKLKDVLSTYFDLNNLSENGRTKAQQINDKVGKLDEIGFTSDMIRELSKMQKAGRTRSAIETEMSLIANATFAVENVKMKQLSSENISSVNARLQGSERVTDIAGYLRQLISQEQLDSLRKDGSENGFISLSSSDQNMLLGKMALRDAGARVVLTNNNIDLASMQKIIQFLNSQLGEQLRERLIGQISSSLFALNASKLGFSDKQIYSMIVDQSERKQSASLYEKSQGELISSDRVKDAIASDGGNEAKIIIQNAASKIKLLTESELREIRINGIYEYLRNNKAEDVESAKKDEKFKFVESESIYSSLTSKKLSKVQEVEKSLDTDEKYAKLSNEEKHQKVVEKLKEQGVVDSSMISEAELAKKSAVAEFVRNTDKGTFAAANSYVNATELTRANASLFVSGGLERQRNVSSSIWNNDDTRAKAEAQYRKDNPGKELKYESEVDRNNYLFSNYKKFISEGSEARKTIDDIISKNKVDLNATADAGTAVKNMSQTEFDNIIKEMDVQGKDIVSKTKQEIIRKSNENGALTEIPDESTMTKAEISEYRNSKSELQQYYRKNENSEEFANMYRNITLVNDNETLRQILSKGNANATENEIMAAKVETLKNNIQFASSAMMSVLSRKENAQTLEKIRTYLSSKGINFDKLSVVEKNEYASQILKDKTFTKENNINATKIQSLFEKEIERRAAKATNAEIKMGLTKEQINSFLRSGAGERTREKLIDVAAFRPSHMFDRGMYRNVRMSYILNNPLLRRYVVNATLREMFSNPQIKNMVRREILNPRGRMFIPKAAKMSKAEFNKYLNDNLDELSKKFAEQMFLKQGKDGRFELKDKSQFDRFNKSIDNYEYKDKTFGSKIKTTISKVVKKLIGASTEKDDEIDELLNKLLKKVETDSRAQEIIQSKVKKPVRLQIEDFFIRGNEGAYLLDVTINRNIGLNNAKVRNVFGNANGKTNAKVRAVEARLAKLKAEYNKIA